MIPTACQCPAAGFCEILKRRMGPAYWEMCRTKPGYFETFAADRDRRQASRGLGDTIAKFTEATGIATVVKAIAGDDCGCDKRQEWLNKVVPYSSDPPA